MHEKELSLLVDTHILFNIKYLKRIGMPTYGLDSRQYLKSLMSFLPSHADHMQVRQMILSKTHLCTNITRLYGQLVIMFPDMSDGFKKGPENPKELGEHDGGTRYEYVKIILVFAGKYLHEPEGYKKFQQTLQEHIYCQERVVAAFYHLNMASENLSLVQEALWRESRIIEVDETRSIPIQSPMCQITQRNPLQEAEIIAMKSKIRSQESQFDKLIQNLEQQNLILARAAVWLLPELAAAFLEQNKARRPYHIKNRSLSWPV